MQIKWLPSVSLFSNFKTYGGLPVSFQSAFVTPVNIGVFLARKGEYFTGLIHLMSHFLMNQFADRWYVRCADLSARTSFRIFSWSISGFMRKRAPSIATEAQAQILPWFRIGTFSISDRIRCWSSLLFDYWAEVYFVSSEYVFSESNRRSECFRACLPVSVLFVYI